ncbi:MAG: hypothetical protein QG635_2409, partial [Bacteroidota bacterium]|nr:hypothetical protein [Bacteroidota bacterium]
MIKSMTGFGRFEIKEEGIRVSAEIKSLNGRFTDINCKLSKSIQNKELEIRELIRNNIIRGSIHISINVEVEDISKQIVFNEPAAVEFYQKLNSLRTKLKLREAVNMTHLLQFSSYFFDKNAEEDTDNHWKLTIKAINEALKALDKMKKIEGQKLMKDMQ